MAQTSTLCHEEALRSPKTNEPAPEKVAAPSERVIRNILAFSRNLEVRPSALLSHVSFVKS